MAKQSAHGPGAVENPKSPSVLDISSSYWLEETRGSPDCAFVERRGRMHLPWWTAPLGLMGMAQAP